MARFDVGPIHEIPRADGVLKKVRILDGQLFLCATGCCCGRTDKGFPALPLDRFKSEWKARGIRRRFHLTVGGCLGPCTMANVALVQFHGESVWLHSINDPSDVDAIYDWAETMLAREEFLPPPPVLAGRQFQRSTIDSIDQSDCAIQIAPKANTDDVDHGHTHKPGDAHDHGGAGHDHGHGHTHAAAGWLDYVRIGGVALAALVTWLLPWRPVPQFDLLGLIAALCGGYPIYRHAVQDALRRRMTMELSMTIALISALVIGETLTALVIVFFVLVAEILEGMTVERGRSSIRQLLDHLPATVDLLTPAGVTTVAIDTVRPDDVVLVRPGERIPVDGVVTEGTSFVDQSFVTGESAPAEKLPGASVYASTINQSGALHVRVQAVGADTAYGRIVWAVEQAEHTQAPVQRLADTLAGYLVYFALGSAAVTFAVTHDARATISTIIVAGACGIAAGTPLAILGAIGRAARAGAIVKGGRHLEELSRVDTVVFDKTGTLTLGSPVVTRVEAVAGTTEFALLRLIASAERPSEHPLGKAIVAHAASQRIDIVAPARFAYEPGKGLTCVVDGRAIVVGTEAFLVAQGVRVPSELAPFEGSSVLIAGDGAYLGRVLLEDVVREGAANAVSRLKARGLRTVLLTGDAPRIADAVGRALGVETVEASMLPHQKLARINDLRSSGRKVVMVGDGINDGPALMAANVGIAMGSGTDVARESASIVLIGDDPGRVVEVLDIARQCRRIIITNFAGTIAVDLVGVVLASMGLLNPILAALVHVTSELVFIGNSARLLTGGTRGLARGRPQPSDGDGPGTAALSLARQGSSSQTM